MTGAVSTSAPTVVGVRAASAGISSPLPAVPLPKVAMTRPAARSVVRSAIAGRPAPGCSASKRRATGPTSRAATSAWLLRAFRNKSRIDAFGLFTGQVGYAANNVPVLRQGRCGRDLGQVSIVIDATNMLNGSTSDDTRWGGVVGVGLEYGFAPNWSAAVEYDHLFMQDRTYNFTTPGGAVRRYRSHPSGRRSRHRPPELQVRRPGRRQVLSNKY